MITSKVDTLIFNASYLITVNKENQVHKNYSIAITNGQITHIAPTEELAHLEAKNEFRDADERMFGYCYPMMSVTEWKTYSCGEILDLLKQSDMLLRVLRLFLREKRRLLR